ncbi:MAG: alpha-2-macroglobulin family protein [Omnitrophica WOR_2 bacterium]
MAQNPKRFNRRYGILSMAVLAVLLVSAGAFWFWRSRQPSSPGGQQVPLNQGSPSTSVQAGPAAVSGSASGGGTSSISIRLSEGQAQPQAVQPLPVATGEPLSQQEIDQVLNRLPVLTAEPGEQTEFKMPKGPLPPPRTGQTIPEVFPPAPGPAVPAKVDSGPLQVLRYAPEGEIPIAPFVNITFNQPMVPLATLSDLASAQVPVKMEPSLPGTWRWLGTRTLTFQYDSALIDRLPKATNYHVTIPARTKSMTGGVLEKTIEWTFSTPPPRVTTSYPNSQEPQPLDPLFFISFDQRVDPQAVLGTIKVTAAGRPVGIKIAGEAEILKNETVRQLRQDTPEGRWVAFRAQEPLPANSNIEVAIGPGTPSAEGPLTTTEVQSYSFHTYAPLQIADHGCSYGNNECVPLAPFFIRFNNPLDASVYKESMLRISPELPGASVNIYGDTIQITGASKGQTTYTIVVSGDIQDTFGQKLGTDTTLSFKVGKAQPMLFGPGMTLFTLDPASKKPVFSVYAINYPKLDVQIYAVQPSDWPAFKEYLRNYQRTDVQLQIPGRKVLDKSLPVESAADELNEVDIDLSPYMDGAYGHFIVIVKPPSGLFANKDNIYWQAVQAWVQVTQIGLDAYVDHSEMVAWTTDLKNGSPLPGIALKAGNTGFETTTGDDGTVRFPIPDGASYLVASQGADQALLPNSNDFWSEGSWSHTPVKDELRWYVFDDRQMYRPGEEVHIKGWLRRIGGKQDGDVGLAGDAVSGVNYQIMESQGNPIGSGKAEVNSLGGFDFTFTIPQQVNLGYAQLNLNAEGDTGQFTGSQYGFSFQIQEFRRPEFEVNARNETAGPYFAGEHAVLAVEAKYYAGGALPNADVTWQVTSSPGQYSPPKWPDFTFGTWTPWWYMGGIRSAYESKPFFPGGPQNTGKVETFTGKTDASGTHYLQLDFGADSGPEPVSISAQATVMDVNRQAWTGTTTLLVHPADLYIGLRGDKVFVERGTPLKIDFIVTDIDGNAIADRPVEVRAARLEWKFKDGAWGEEEVDVQKCSQGSAEKPVTCTFQTELGGSYRITATVTDDKGRQNQSQLTRWVSGGKIPPARNVQQETLTLIPDKETYQPGDVAEILVQSPFSPAEGLLTVSRNGILYTERFQIKEDTVTLKVPIEEKYIPNLNIQVDVNGSAERTDDQGQALKDVPPRPAFATGQLNLEIPPVQRTLALEVNPEQKELEPGGETSLNLVLNDAGGQPVADAELSVVVVDEAILALSNYQMADPLQVFYSDRPSYLSAIYGRSSIVLANPQAITAGARGDSRAALQVMEKSNLTAGAAAPMEAPAAQPTMTASAADMAHGTSQEPIRIRSDFNPLAVFAPSVHTDASGAARVAVKLPDNLTRYRVMVVAVDSQGRRFGKGEANITARLPLMVRPSAPHFLNFGDRFELPVLLQNQTGQPMTVDVAVRATNLDMTGSQGARVTVPANDRIEVRFPAAAQMAGTARIQIAAVSGGYADAATVELPVYTPATTEAFATYGVIDEGMAVQPVASPTNVFPQYGGLEISTSSTALQALTDAVLYIVQYPYEGAEQISSRVLSIAALKDVLTAFQSSDMPSPDTLVATVQKDIQTLQGLQNEDGGFPYWRRGMDSIPFDTIHVAHALHMAQAKGFNVPADMQQRLMEYLKNIESHYPTWYDQNTRWTLSAYALYVRNISGDKDYSKALKLLDDAGLDKLSLDAIGWLWPVLEDASGTGARLDEIRTYVNNHAVETAGAANFTTSYDDQNYLLLGSDRRTDAILLDALIGDNPQHDLIPKVVNGLLAHRKAGRWDNTQENVFVLLALDRYFNTFEAQTPDFVANIWLGQAFAGSHEYHGRTTERRETDIPMSYLVDPANGGGTTQDLILNKEGTGRLYYRLGLRYAPSNLHLDPLDMGFVVKRVYEAMDNPEDVRLDQDGVWHIKAGARVRVRITMVADNRRYHVALSDPLPAGLEIVNPALAVSGSVPQDPKSPDYRYGWWWWGTWYEHQNLRDERAEAFTSLLWDGVYDYSYIARATTPGTFVVPPAKAEEMYSPEVFGRSGSDTVVVE